jgi:hypothetical protein
MFVVGRMRLCVERDFGILLVVDDDERVSSGIADGARRV